MGLYLITGGSGFFGSILKSELLNSGNTCVNVDLTEDLYEHANLTSIKGDIRDLNLLEDIFSKYKFDAIFHCAAILAHDKGNFKNLWSSNVDGTKNIAGFAKKHGVNKVVFISSNCLWGKNFDGLVTEDEKPSPIEIYGKTKLEGEKILFEYKNCVNSIIFRSPTIVDEGRLGLLAILFEFIDENRKIWMVGDGNNKYQFIYAKDLAKACILALNYYKTEIFNIGSDDVKSFNEVYSYIIEKSGSKSKLVHMPKGFLIWGMKLASKLGISPLGPYQYNMIASNFVFDTSKVKRELGFEPTLKNEEMMLKAYSFYHQNKNEIKHRKNRSAHSTSAKMGIIRLIKWLS